MYIYIYICTHTPKACRLDDVGGAGGAARPSPVALVQLSHTLSIIIVIIVIIMSSSSSSSNNNVITIIIISSSSN